MTSNTPTIFDTFVNEITKNLDDILGTVKDFNGSTDDAPDEAPVASEEQNSPVNPTDPLSVEGLAGETVRLLKAAENTDYVDEGEQLIRIADRYIRLTELALAADIQLG